MKRISLFILLSISVSMLLGCTPTANTTTSNTANTANANSAKSTAAAPTAETLLDMDKKMNEAWLKGDTKTFEDKLSAKFIGYHDGQRYDRSEEIKMVGSVKCDAKESKLEEPQMVKIDDNTYVIAYKGTHDGECEFDGNKMKIPSPVRAASVWIKEGDSWKGAYHAETPIIDPANPPAAPAKADDAKKEEPKKDVTASNSNTAANTQAAPAKPTPSSNTDALVKLHQAGWNAFKAKDAKFFNETLTSNFAFVDPIGGWHSGRDNAVKAWTETMKCEGINNVSVTDGFSTALSPTVEILTLKGTADGTCDGQKNGALYQTAIYVKEGDAWKLAFMFEQPVEG